jgi:hypothetical protein
LKSTHAIDMPKIEADGLPVIEAAESEIRILGDHEG